MASLRSRVEAAPIPVAKKDDIQKVMKVLQVMSVKYSNSFYSFCNLFPFAYMS